MPDRINRELDPLFETIGLLIVSCQADELKLNMIKGLKELGLDGERFYESNLRVFDNYINIFRKHCVLTKEDEFFLAECDSRFLLVILSLMMDNRELLIKLDEIESDEINKELIEICKSVLEIETSVKEVKTLEDIVSFLDAGNIEQKDKWKLMRVMQRPKTYLKQLLNMINRNMKAYEKAKSGIGPQLSKLLNDCCASFNEKERFYKMTSTLSESSDIYPTLAFPLAQMIFEKVSYYGLFSSIVRKDEENNRHSKEKLLYGLKALSDKSKLEILCSLKVSPKYNLEIANQLGLTAATMSHHMNVLLTCGFVGVNKQDGRVYYHLESESIRIFLNILEQMLL